MARMTKAEKTAQVTKATARREEAIRIVSGGVCPCCGAGIRRNLSMAGWYQCQQYGAPGFRKDANKPSCGWQTFTV